MFKYSARAIAFTMLLPAMAICTGGCAIFKSANNRAEVMEFDPILITPSQDDLALANLNDEELFAMGSSAFVANDLEKASRCFNRLVDLFPQSAHQREAAFNAGLAMERLGNYAHALERFLSLMDPAQGKGDSLHAAFRAAECYYHLDDYPAAIKILAVIGERRDISMQDQLEARVHRGVCMMEGGDLEGAQKVLHEALSFWELKRDAEQLDEYFPSQAQFFLGEVYRVYFERVVLAPESNDLEKLAKDLEHKCEMLLFAQGHYLRAIRMGHAQWATAAGFRIGELYENLYDAMLNAKPPAGLSAEEAEVYRQELRKKTKVLVTKAIGIYEDTLAAAERMGLDSPFVAKTKQSFERLKRILLDDLDRGAFFDRRPFNRHQRQRDNLAQQRIVHQPPAAI